MLLTSEKSSLSLHIPTDSLLVCTVARYPDARAHKPAEEHPSLSRTIETTLKQHSVCHGLITDKYSKVTSIRTWISIAEHTNIYP